MLILIHTATVQYPWEGTLTIVNITSKYHSITKRTDFKRKHTVENILFRWLVYRKLNIASNNYKASYLLELFLGDSRYPQTSLWSKNHPLKTSTTTNMKRLLEICFHAKAVCIILVQKMWKKEMLQSLASTVASS